MPENRLTRCLILLLAATLCACQQVRETASPMEAPTAPQPDAASSPPVAPPVATTDATTMAGETKTVTDRATANPAPPRTIWPRLRAGFQLPDDIDHPALLGEIDWLVRHQPYLDRVFERAEPFIYYITEETRKRGLPTELVLLPVVESAYQPFAYSHGRAAGLWQFIPSTGRLYGLKQNWWYDGRRDIHASTRAALDYLQYLNGRFNGDWLLALAAYNAGSGTVMRAIERNRKRRLPTDFWHLQLPRETRAYVPKLLALKAVIRDPENYGLHLRHIADVPALEQVETRAQIDLALVAELAGLSMEELYRYNPAYNRWATAPDGPHRFILPAEAATRFRRNYARLPDDKHLKWVRHKIRAGETLSEIALQYHSSVRHIKQVNQLATDRIRVGKHLLVPVASRNQADYVLSAPQRQYSLTSKPRRGARRLGYTVKKGDSFWLIARRFGVDMHKLARWNGMAIKDPLKPGKNLTIWQKKGGTPRRHKADRRIQSISYTVKSGDSLSRIAERYQVSVKDINRWNTIRGKYIQPGQKLKLYIDVTEQSGNQG